MSKYTQVKSEKAKAKSNFFMGIIFWVIGLILCLAIPLPTKIMIIWTIFYGVVIVSCGITAFSSKGLPSNNIINNDNIKPNNREPQKTPEERLEELKDLFEKGLISVGEYQEKKDSILKEI